MGLKDGWESLSEDESLDGLTSLSKVDSELGVGIETTFNEMPVREDDA